jgi:hypothetical protein
MKQNLLCNLFGHKRTGVKTPVYDFSGICYYADKCPRCGKRSPFGPEDIPKKAAKEEEIAAVMNGERARYGLKPISWET